MKRHAVSREAIAAMRRVSERWGGSLDHRETDDDEQIIYLTDKVHERVMDICIDRKLTVDQAIIMLAEYEETEHGKADKR